MLGLLLITFDSVPLKISTLLPLIFNFTFFFKARNVLFLALMDRENERRRVSIEMNPSD